MELLHFLLIQISHLPLSNGFEMHKGYRTLNKIVKNEGGEVIEITRKTNKSPTFSHYITPKVTKFVTKTNR